MTPRIVSVSWLHEHRADADVVVVDARPPAFFLQGHIPGSVSLPVFFLNGPGGLPDPGQVARRLGQIGVRRAAHVIAADDGTGAMAGRLYWVLRAMGHEAVSVVDGGVTAWAHAGYDYENQVVPRAPVTYGVGAGRPDAIASADDVLAAMGAPDSVIVDVRTPAEFLGLDMASERPGHVPGAVNVDIGANLERGDDGLLRFLPEDALRTLYETAGAGPDKQVIVYCQSGNRSSEAFLVLESLGYGRVKNYAAGWQEWGNRADTPVES